ncbi:hypothetical protein [Ornithinibacillus halotolerans]|uniref:Uncharacterized protein n=1 Tax=Ornithinibacillus halotolerans TaxID=1274357 RepID=A0A916S2U7_9BACI|nr:hypothetical protein [Ornithinibacillus halotolerans]GGA81643.1 hypothetical protein GCM10008025_26170 [Ornithinibacillus halotolerans]
MFLFEEDADLVQDREDLLSILRMRFGDISPEIIEGIYEIDKLDTLERLILVAANAPTFKVFMEELQEEGSFRIVGDRFNPLSSLKEGEL